MINEIFELIMDIGVASSIIPLLMLLFIYRKAHRESWWALFVIASIWFVVEYLNWILTSNNINNHIVFHLFGMLSIIAYSSIFYRIIDYKRFRSFLIRLVILIELFSFSYVIISGTWFQISTTSMIIYLFTPLFLSVYYFYYVMKEASVKRLVLSPYYWLSSAMLIHYGMAFFTLIISTMTTLNSEMTTYLWPIVSVSNIIATPGII